MPRQYRHHNVPVVAVLLIAVGCESRFAVLPPDATRESYADQIAYDSLPPATRELYDALFDGQLAGADAAEFQPLLDTAQRITDRRQSIVYEFQLAYLDKPFDEVREEGVPYLYVKVQKKYGLIYECDVSAPEF